ncbi:MAG: hypothetical protein DMF56_08455 [Acidobacteria bacterium]|nr:MAG: hypothetical protein DMF56_08455 [Acidobacteriota bacterium]
MDFYTFDDEYVRRLLERDSETCAHFYSYFGELLLIKLRKRLDTMQAIDDVRQEVFLRTLDKLAEVKDGRKFGSFVNSICNYVLMEWYRIETKSDQFARVSFDEATTRTTEEELLSEETTRTVRRTLAQLEPRDREILCALFLEEVAKNEVCRKFGVDRKYLRVLVYRAKEHFRSHFPPDAR